MKKIIYFLVLVLALALIGYSQIRPVDKSISIVSADYKEEGEFYKYDIKIPQIKDEKSEDFTYFNLTMQENMRYIIENLSNKENDGGIEEAYISFENHKNSFGILSISVLTNVYKGGAHSMNNVESYNMSLKERSILSLDKIFTDDAIEYFNMMINDKIKNKERVLNTKGKEVIFFDNAEADINNAVVYFEGDNVVFIFLEYDLSPYSSGMPVFKFNKREIKKYLNV
ncbi:Protein of uncharacterised function (DUF3298) [Fusobacterium necrogenes]|uniref:Protein of uncharacterized function (DUF3298) n=1 Tax=Fusobacterium necrogenes TaxID=858 RepID=A0A377GX44_9FUSO|nr:DUF4163 domain-containing protein [Fusobacterium necrogenes]STO31560.1 Protein of uncharacterised function (DUF3298) [Fusobacterium necrogenes]